MTELVGLMRKQASDVELSMLCALTFPICTLQCKTLKKNKEKKKAIVQIKSEKYMLQR